MTPPTPETPSRLEATAVEIATAIVTQTTIAIRGEVKMAKSARKKRSMESVVLPATYYYDLN